MNDRYHSVRKQGRSMYRERGSRFIGIAAPIATEEAAESLVREIRKKYFDASHVCYAYLIGPEMSIFKAHDAGEPRHSAGDPILNQIRSLKISDVIVIVVRYFGGTKLGTSGLAVAYKHTAKAAIENAGILQKTVVVTLEVEFSFEKTNELMKIIASAKDIICRHRFSGGNNISLEIFKSREGEFRKMLGRIHGIIVH